MQKIPQALSYNDIGLIPRKLSTLQHRAEADISVNFCGIKLEIPLIASPMPDVCNGEMAGILAYHGAIGVIHRFQTIEKQLEEYHKACMLAGLSSHIPGKDLNVACAIGATGDYIERLQRLYESGCKIFCIDTANGFNTQVEKAIKTIRNFYYTYSLKDVMISPGPTPEDCTAAERWRQEQNNKIYIIAGNVASAEGFKYLANLGVDAIRVGIAGGSVCITRTETGIYYPMASSVIECAEAALSIKNAPLLIADGGIQLPSDLSKCLALGADIAMAGSIFAGTKEAPGGVIKDKEGRLFKLYRGAASFGVQKEHSGEEPAYNEGNETLVPYKNGGVEKVIERFKAGLRSSFSYMNARNLEDFKNNSHYVII